MSDDEFISPANEFFEVEEENNFENKKEKVEPKENTTFFSFLYKQFECCCLSYFNELKEKDQRRTITLKRNNVDEYNKNKNNTNEFSVFNKIIKKNAELMSEIPLNSKYFNPHADWCECAHELDVELSNEEVEFCIFTFFLKMYRLETRDKELLLSIILDCLFSKKDFKKEYYGYKGSFKFLKEIKNIETSNFKESLNSLINIIENMNVTQKHTTTPTIPTAITTVNNFTNFNNNNSNNNNNNNGGGNNLQKNNSEKNKNTYNSFNTNIIPPNNNSTNNTNMNININNVNNLNRNNNHDTPSDYMYRNKNNLESYTNTTLKESNTYSREELNKKFYFKLYVVLKIKYPYGVYIFNCGESYDIVVLDCNTKNNNKPKIMSFYSLRKFVSFLNNMHSINYNGEDVYDSFPIIIYESRECYVSTNSHVALKPEVCESKRHKEKWKVEEILEDSENEQNRNNEKDGAKRRRADNEEETEEDDEEEEEDDDEEEEEEEEEEDEQEEDNENMNEKKKKENGNG